MTPPMGAGLGGGMIPTGEELRNRRERGDERIRTNLRTVRKARFVKLAVIEQVRSLQAKVFQADTGAEVEAGITAFLSGGSYDVIDIQLQGAAADEWGAIVVYAADDDRATFEAAVDQWFLDAGENDLIEIQYQHTDRAYRAMILYTE